MPNPLILFSPPREILIPSSSEGNSLAPGEAESDDPSRALSPPTMEDTEVSSQRPSPGRGGADETVLKTPEDNTSDAVERGTTTPMTTEGGGPQQSGPSPNTISETSTAPASDQHPTLKEGEEQELRQQPLSIRRPLTLCRKRYNALPLSRNTAP